MDRLSAYAERESESEPEEDRKRSEEEATTRLLEKLQISNDTKPADSNGDKATTENTNGETGNRDKPAGESLEVVRNSANEEGKSQTASGEVGSDARTPKRNRGIPEDVKLYEIFYGQVTHLVHAQRLPIQDTIALLVSLAHLAL